jgi:hypothetical protein
MSKDDPIGTYSADSKYTITELASKMGVSEKWIKENLVGSGEYAHKRRRNSYFLVGQRIING